MDGSCERSKQEVFVVGEMMVVGFLVLRFFGDISDDCFGGGKVKQKIKLWYRVW